MQIVIKESKPVVSLTSRENAALAHAKAILEQLARYPELFPEAAAGAEAVGKVCAGLGK